MIISEYLNQPSLSRRGLLAGAGSLAALAATGARFPAFAGSLPPVISFHADAPYLDLTGLAQPIQLRSAADWANGLDDEAILRLGLTL